MTHRHTRARTLPGILLVAAGLALVPLAVARADAGPKPSMNFAFEFEVPEVPIVGGQLLECDDEACATAEPLEELGPQRFSCSEESCSSLAYTYASYHKLRIEFADRTRESDVFGKRAYRASYRVTVTEAALQVEEVSRGGLAGLCPAWPLTLLLETAIAALYLGAFRLPRTLLGWVPLSSLLTLPIVWLAFPLLGLPGRWGTGLAEGFAVTAEAGLLYAAAHGAVPLRHVAALSLVMNAASFSLGLLV